MQNLKSQPAGMFLEVFQRLLDDVYKQATPFITTRHTDLSRDIIYVTRRFKHEGVSFFTKTLPLLYKSLLKGLESGLFRRPDNFRGWKGSLPAFMRGFFSHVFSIEGALRRTVEPTVVKLIAQVCQFFYKIRQPFTPNQVYLFSKRFKQTDLSARINRPISHLSYRILNKARELITMLFSSFDPSDILPRHGPGAVASGEKSSEKKQFKRLYRSIHNVYPYPDYFFTRLSFSGAAYMELTRMGDPIAKLTFVPKDSRGPRVISMEPLEVQFVQQGLMRRLYEHVESHPLTMRRINFSDQTVNQRFALIGSITGEYATIDLKDASDLVSLDLVKELFRDTDLLRYLIGTRSTSVLLPDKDVWRLNKFASMGSALCFPIEAIVFFALAKAIGEMCDVNSSVYVYGDDIICQPQLARLIIELFPVFGLQVNSDKSFLEGKFRESCGTDWYNGESVRPIFCRTLLAGKHDVQDTLSLIALTNNLFDSHYYGTSSFLKAYIERKLGRRLPHIKKDSHLIGFHSYDPTPRLKTRYNQKLQRLEVWSLGIRTKKTEFNSGYHDEDREYFRKLTQGWNPDFLSHRYTERHCVTFSMSYKEVEH
jgi:hypothetical protein